MMILVQLHREVAIDTHIFTDHVKNYRPKHHQLFIYGDIWGDNSSYGKRFGRQFIR